MRLERIGRENTGCRCTVHSERCGITRSTGCIADRTRVFSRVSGCHSVDRQYADTLAGIYYRYIVMVTRNRLAVQGPLDLDRVIPFQYRARCGDGVPPIRWSLSDHEWHEFRCNCGQHNMPEMFNSSYKASDKWNDPS